VCQRKNTTGMVQEAACREHTGSACGARECGAGVGTRPGDGHIVGNGHNGLGAVEDDRVLDVKALDLPAHTAGVVGQRSRK